MRVKVDFSDMVDPAFLDAEVERVGPRRSPNKGGRWGAQGYLGLERAALAHRVRAAAEPVFVWIRWSPKNNPANSGMAACGTLPTLGDVRVGSESSHLATAPNIG